MNTKKPVPPMDYKVAGHLFGLPVFTYRGIPPLGWLSTGCIEDGSPMHRLFDEAMFFHEKYMSENEQPDLMALLIYDHLDNAQRLYAWRMEHWMEATKAGFGGKARVKYVELA